LTPGAARSIYGVDFSGAARAGDFIWIARLRPAARGRARLESLDRLADLHGRPDRDSALAFLVEKIGGTEDAVWGIDFPFGLPIEVMPGCETWADQLAEVRRFEGQAVDFGRRCVESARAIGERLHIRRATDSLARTPFDCYHYRIIYQTFHGMRDVLLPLRDDPGTAVLPFDYPRLADARRVVLEACPGSTLRRWGTPHNRYKQPAGGRLTAARTQNRRAILQHIESAVSITEAQRREMMLDPGADALDATVAALGTWEAWRSADHAAIAADPRVAREGWVYA